MYVRHLIGPRKGEIEDVVFDAARSLIEQGAAEDVYGQLSKPIQPEVQSKRAESVHVETSKKKTGRR